MDDDWDSENFEPQLFPNHALNANKWAGEDEDDVKVKDSWEDEEEEKKDVEKPESKPKAKPKKTLADKLAEKEALRQLELERKQQEKEKDMTPEERLAEKLRRQKLQEESDLEVAKETFGIIDSKIDALNPISAEDFAELASGISKKVNNYSTCPEYPSFVEDLFRNICVTLSSNDLKKIKLTVDNLYLEKQKIEKGQKAKKNKGKGKAILKMEGDNSHLNEYSAYQDYDYDDFM